MARADDFHPDPLDVLADYHDLPRDQFWATYPSVRAVVSLGSFGEAGDLLGYLGGLAAARRRA